MLILPGQGVLTIITGLIFLDYPGKFKFERLLVRNKLILNSMNWIRRKLNKPDLIIWYYVHITGAKMSVTNQKWILKERPNGLVKKSDFDLIEEEITDIKNGEILVKNSYLSFDPTQYFYFPQIFFSACMQHKLSYLC